jgi:hypothetical protein
MLITFNRLLIIVYMLAMWCMLTLEIFLRNYNECTQQRCRYNYISEEEKIPLPEIESGYQVKVTQVKKSKQYKMGKYLADTIWIAECTGNMRKVW